MTEPSKMKKILSIDGGGIRGIVPGQILVTLEKKLQDKSGSKDARIADYFDMIAGTSTGGILSCIYLYPSDADPKRPKFTAKQAVDLYVENGGDIFDVSIWQKILNGLNDEKYKAIGLENALQKYFGDKKLSQLLKSCLITSYDIFNRKGHFFTKFELADTGNKAMADKDNYKVRDVCRATSAAPTYFETALIDSLSGVSYPLIDGGVFANNPTLCAYSEIRNQFPDLTAKDMVILSLGTGSVSEPYKYEDAKDYGKVEWIVPLIDIMMSASSEVNDYHVRKMFEAVKRMAEKNNERVFDQYFRISPDNLMNADKAMDNASTRNLNALVELGTKTAEDNDILLDKIADFLVSDDPSKLPPNGDNSFLVQEKYN